MERNKETRVWEFCIEVWAKMNVLKASKSVKWKLYELNINVYFLTGGAAEFVSQASQGILQGAGLVRVPEKLFVVQKEMLQEIVGCESHMKLMW